jgi:uncharacterized protein YndB with AHSA1/START domain
MPAQQITVSATVSVDKQKAWQYYTLPEHITQWNFADPSWHCPSASNDLIVGGRYIARMEARDGSFGFDFDAVYTEINEGQSFSYLFGDRLANVTFNESDGQTEVVVSFEPEEENPIELQQNGWQAILNNYKAYAEAQLGG